MQWLATRRKKVRLTQLLENPNYRWRAIEYLSKAIDTDVAETTELLVRIGARRSVGKRDREIWGLTSKVGPEPVLREYFDKTLTSSEYKEILREASPDVEDVE
jgi:hypothetical protein